MRSVAQQAQIRKLARRQRIGAVARRLEHGPKRRDYTDDFIAFVAKQWDGPLNEEVEEVERSVLDDITRNGCIGALGLEDVHGEPLPKRAREFADATNRHLEQYLSRPATRRPPCEPDWEPPAQAELREIVETLERDPLPAHERQRRYERGRRLLEVLRPVREAYRLMDVHFDELHMLRRR